MSQPTGITINNTHLLRAAMLLMVLGIIGPGLFQLKPPQWFAEPGRTEHLEMVATDSVPSPMAPVTVPAAPSPEAPIVEPPALEAADSGSKLSESKAAGSSAPVAVARAPETVPAKATPPEKPAVAARKVRPKPSSDDVASMDMKAPQQTEMASIAPRTARLPAVPDPSSTPLEVRRTFTKSIPESHTTLPVKRQKESFIAITLPLILAANEEISQRRNAIKRAVSRGDQATVERWARLYRIDTEEVSLAEIERQLLLRADFVPVSLALAQAVIESGWGTSRFALQGNALFGQWAWQKDAGLKPARASNSEAVVRSFPNLFGSVRAYMHNLNTHPRYAAFRARRHLLRGRTQAELGYQLSNFLDGYAEIGEVYVAKLKALIRSNDFGQYEAARLR